MAKNTGFGLAYNQGVALARKAGAAGLKAHKLTRTQMDVLTIDSQLWFADKTKREEITTEDQLYAALIEGFTHEFEDLYGGVTEAAA